ncbi:response regulator [Fulvivirga sedimenti]|uniref:Response regulator n=1 Tax=Fulvivirga sedimenti TaxID=2879465 RepID=A0A9X1KUP0_9BACT|nr:response regulator [Fulvivirga sedimenti]MCA6073713.1 response regulator [Fulvivirga sedimenti]
MGKRILLADDSPVLQSLTKKILEVQGYAFQGVKNGGKVIELIETGDFDLLILDIILPDANGMELAREIRKSKDPHVASLPIIGISGNYMNYSDADFADAGMNKFLLKPLNYDELLVAIKTLIEV